MARLRIIVAGGDEDARWRLVNELTEKLELYTRTDGAGPRLYSTDDDADQIRFRSLTTY